MPDNYKPKSANSGQATGRKNKEMTIFRLSITALLVVFFFGYGVVVATFYWWPYDTVHQVYQIAKSLYKFGVISPQDKLVDAPEGASRKIFTIQNPDLMQKGYYVFLGWDTEAGLYSAKLFGSQGNQVHTWLLDYAAYDPDSPAGNDQPHGFVMMPDGSITVNFDRGNAMVRLDKCGTPMWIKKGNYHHSINIGYDGTGWAWRGEGSAYSQYQFLSNFDPKDGRTIKEISLIDDIIKKMTNPWEVFLLRADYPFIHGALLFTSELDIFHPNDIEVLSEEYAPYFEGFKAGDLVISINKLNLIAVIDPETNQVKWWRHGPWRAQHDPDFLKDGTISVFNNNDDLGRSEIIRVDPESGKAYNDLAKGSVRFFAASMGEHQYLPNGNVLITVPDEGRILEVSPTGDIVMEYNNISIHGDHNAHVENAMWVPMDYFTDFPECPKQAE
jgi:hypothetical protein